VGGGKGRGGGRLCHPFSRAMFKTYGVVEGKKKEPHQISRGGVNLQGREGGEKRNFIPPF